MFILEFLQSFFISLTPLFALILNPFSLIICIIVILVLIKKNKECKDGSYYKITKNSYLSTKQNVGKYGEYLIYKYLKPLEASGAKFLFNVYIPKENGETTEIDVLMICSKGIFVFESKNYSGWIFGSETQKNWYQTLPKGRGRSHKENFFNPIMQNRSHINHLKTFIGEEFPVTSIIVFSERCTLKNIQIKSSDISVIKRYDVCSTVSKICNQTTVLLSETDILSLYNKLYPCTQVDDATKKQHIINIENNILNRQTDTVSLKNTSAQIIETSSTIVESDETTESSLEEKE